MTVRRPVMRYHGGKWRLASWVISHFPPHRVYVEPYGGAGSVLLKKAPAFAEIYNDLDDGIVNLFRVLRDPEQAEQLRRLCELTPFARAEFQAAYELTDDPIEAARRILVRSWMGHGASGVRQHKTGFRVNPHRQRTTATMDWNGWPEAVPAMVRRLRDVTIEHRPAVEIIAQQDDPHTLFYLDPPYPFSTRSQKRKRGDLYHGYRHEMKDADHEAMLELVGRLEGMVVISGYGCELYDDALADWRRVETKAFADRGEERTEVLWINDAAVEAGRLPFGKPMPLWDTAP